MDCDQINTQLYQAEMKAWQHLIEGALEALIPPPPPPPPPAAGIAVDEYMTQVEVWGREDLLPALKEACSG